MSTRKVLLADDKMVDSYLNEGYTVSVPEHRKFLMITRDGRTSMVMFYEEKRDNAMDRVPNPVRVR